MPAAPASSAPYGQPPVAVRRSGALGAVALVLALVATVGAGLFGAIAGFNIGIGAGKGFADLPMDGTWDWSILTPVRDWVLLGEVSFWVGTALGVWALVQGFLTAGLAAGTGIGG